MKWNVLNLRLVSLILFTNIVLMSAIVAQSSGKKLQALIVDGENNHGAWPKTSMMMKSFLEETGLFNVDIARKAFTWQGPHNAETVKPEDRQKFLKEYSPPALSGNTAVDEPKVDPGFNPDFEAYDVVISNLGWKATEWPEETKRKFENFMRNGGGLVIVHAANNSFGDWNDYNKMIGLGGWGGRSTKDGPYVYYNDDGEFIKDSSEGACGSHGPQQEFLITTRNLDHPINRGLPLHWMHTKDELYDRLRGPAENITVLATAYSDVEKNGPPWAKDVKGSGRHEPMLFTVNYDKGRVFHTVLGHTDYSMECVGFMITFQRGTEWAATGKVTQTDLPADFPSEASTSQREWKH